MMNKIVAMRKIKALKEVMENAQLIEVGTIQARIDGIRHAVFNRKKECYQYYYDLKNNKDGLSKRVYESFIAGMKDAENCYPGRPKTETVTLNRMSIPTELKKQLEVIKKQKKFKHINNVRKAAYEYYIESELK